MSKHLVIMAGGIGSRFWPISTPQYPKQFIDITGCGRTMIQQTFDRFNGIVDIDHVWVVTSTNYKELVEEQLYGINPQHILLEPCMCNTAPCIAYVSWKIQKEDPNALIVVAPADHLILNLPKFQETICKGFDFITKGNVILTLGITPTHPEIGYGYIEQGVNENNGIYKLKAFHEKPTLQTAIEYLHKGGYTWNSGMFLWKVNTIINELRQYTPQIASVMDKMVNNFFTENEQSTVNHFFPTCEKISIDYAIMEKTHLAYVLPAEFGWSDLGTWSSLRSIILRKSETNEVTENANAVIGDSVKLIESEGNMINMPNGKQVVIQGLKNCIVSENNNILLICKLSDEQRIREWHK